MMLARYLGDGDADANGVPKPCLVYGLEFPAGEWVMVENDKWAAKLAGNPMFEVDGDVPEAPVVAEPQPEPDPSQDDGPEVDPPTIEQQIASARAALAAKGISFHHKAGLATLTDLLAKA